VSRCRGRPDGAHTCVAVGGAHDDGGNRVDVCDGSKNEDNIFGHGAVAKRNRRPP